MMRWEPTLGGGRRVLLPKTGKSERAEGAGASDSDGNPEAEAAAGPERVVLSFVPGAVADLGAGTGGDPRGDVLPVN